MVLHQLDRKIIVGCDVKHQIKQTFKCKIYFQDVSFVSDVTCAILSGMEDKAVAVRVKGAWSLANLCDALALNR